MRILMVEPAAEFSVADVHAGWLEAFGLLGVEAHVFNLGARLQFYTGAGAMQGDEFRPYLDLTGAVRLASKGLLAACMEMWPDVVLVTTGSCIDLAVLDVLRRHGIKVVVLHTEQPYETERELELAQHADLNLLNDPTNIAQFQAVGPSIYLPHAYRPSVHYPGPAAEDLRSDFVFVGTGFPSRVKFLEQVDWTGVDVALAGMWQTLSEGSPLRPFVAHDLDRCCSNTETASGYRSAKVSCNLYRKEGDGSCVAGWAMGPREVEMAACGLFFLREPRWEGDEVLHMLPKFEDPREFGLFLRWALDFPDKRQRLADKARSAVADRTFTNNAKRLLGRLADL